MSLLAVACGESFRPRGSGGGPGPSARTDGGREDGRADASADADAVDGSRDSGPRDAGHLDAWLAADISNPDAVSFDAGRADARVWPDAAQTADGGAPGITAQAVAGRSSFVVDISPSAPADPVSYLAELSVNNPTGHAETLFVTSASLRIVSTVLYTFQMEPPFSAPLGLSSVSISKIPGSGGSLPLPASLICALGIPATAVIELSNGVLVEDVVTPSCVQ